jgi:hypothetical protein
VANWSEQQLLEYHQRRQDRSAAKLPHKDDEEPDKEKESVLQLKIESWLDSHAIAFVHDRSRGRNRPGQPDIIAAMPYGMTLWIELKAAKGRLSEDQKLFRLKLVRLDHLFYEIRSFKRFLQIAGPMVAGK